MQHDFDVIRTVSTNIRHCPKRTRREKTIRPKISRNDFDLTELERFEVFAGRGVPLVVSRTGDALARIAYDLYWSVMIRLTLLRARYALLFHRPDGDRPALVVDDGSQAGFAAPGKRSLAEKLAARDSARTLAALPEPDDDGDAPPPVDDRTELQRALDKRERHVEKHGRAFDAAAERALLVDHFVAEHRDVAEADVPADHVSRKCDDLVAHQRSLAVWKSTTSLGGPDQTSDLSISVTSKSIRLIFGRIDCSRRVLEAQRNCLCQNIRIRAH